MVVFDSTFLTYLFVPSAPSSVERARERVENLIHEIHSEGGRIIIPSPALSELLIAVGHSRTLILNDLTKSAKFMIAPFDIPAAVEAALMTEAELKKGNKKGPSQSSWNKIKYDRQIIAIAKVRQAKKVYSNDGEVCALAQANGMKAFSVADLKLPYERYSGPELFDPNPGNDE